MTPAHAAVAMTAIVAPVAPPPMRVEVIPAAPFVRAVWIPGHWYWQTGRYVWLPGHYTYPRVGLRWVPAHWRLRGGYWYFAPGRWAR
ncbi:MAG: YXWGXW repeat-containing protein [Proteobacteria bacterium]|nr:YXWGXW repeat-containing protein [Pseudomonadota bacterium]